jgi:hypothetical protein
MMGITITEALAEIKTIGKRLESKRSAIQPYLARQDGVRDPLEKDGGSAKYISQERQAIGDLEERVIALRRGIQNANDTATVSINGKTRTVSEWLTWRRDVAPGQKQFLTSLRNGLQNVRNQARQQGAALVSATATTADTKPTDIVVNIDEAAVNAEAEAIEDTLGQLDGQLSLKNATVTVDA